MSPVYVRAVSQLRVVDQVCVGGWYESCVCACRESSVYCGSSVCCGCGMSPV